MIVWMTRIGMLLLAGCCTVAVLWAPSPWAWMLALSLPAALIGGLAATLALELACARAAAVSSVITPPTPGTFASAWWAELWATSRLVIWRVPLLSNWRPPPLTFHPNGRRGLVLVHGYGCNRAVWAGWQARLEQLQAPCVAINLEPVFASISDYVPLIESAVADMHLRTGRAPVVVAHSMGGLAVRAWWAQTRAAPRLHRLITIATPHQGTVMARFGHGPGAQQMKPDSAWLAALQAQETLAHRQRTLCIYSACDNVVIPSNSAILPDADAHEVTGCAHLALVDHPACFEAALRSVCESA
jgi:triacylglycerol esterase/lipase EstA (alpha/beta hydrolase family)